MIQEENKEESGSSLLGEKHFHVLHLFRLDGDTDLFKRVLLRSQVVLEHSPFFSPLAMHQIGPLRRLLLHQLQNVRVSTKVSTPAKRSYQARDMGRPVIATDFLDLDNFSMALHWLVAKVFRSLACFFCSESYSLVYFLLSLPNPLSSLRLSTVTGGNDNSSTYKQLALVH